MNDNKLYMYQNPQNIRNSASKTSKPVPQLDLSEVNQTKKPKIIRSKRRVTEGPPAARKTQDNFSKDFFDKLDDVILFSPQMSNMCLVDRAPLYGDLELTSLKFYRSYNYGLSLDDLESNALTHRPTTIETTLSANRFNGRSCSSMNNLDEGHPKTARERLASPRGARLEPLKRERDTNRKFDSVENATVTIPKEEHGKIMSSGKKPASVDLKNLTGSVKIRKESNEKPKIGTPTATEKPDMKSIISSSSTTNNSKAHLTGKNQFIVHKNARGLPGAPSKNSPLESNQNTKQLLPTHQLHQKLKEKMGVSEKADEDKPCMTEKPAIHATEKPAISHTGEDERQLVVNNGIMQSNEESKSMILIQEAQPSLEHSPQQNISQIETVEAEELKEIQGTQQSKLEGHASEPSIEEKQPQHLNAGKLERRSSIEGHSSLFSDSHHERKESLHEHGLPTSESLTGVISEIGALNKCTKFGMKAPSVKTLSYGKIAECCDLTQDNDSSLSQESSKLSHSTTTIGGQSKARSTFGSNKPQRDLKFNFNKKIALSTSKIEENTVHQTSGKAPAGRLHSIHNDSPNASSYFLQRGRPKSLSDSKTSVDDIYKRSFNGYISYVEEKIKAIYEYHFKRLYTIAPNEMKPVSEEESHDHINNSKQVERFDNECDRGLGNSISCGRDSIREYFITKQSGSKASEPKQNIYIINIIPPSVNGDAMSQDSFQEKTESFKISHKNEENIHKRSSSEDSSATSPTQTQFEFVMEDSPALHHRKRPKTFPPWIEMEKIEVETLDENKSSLDLFHHTLDMKSYSNYGLDIPSEIFYKTLAYLLQKPAESHRLALESKPEFDNEKIARVGTKSFIFTPRFERYVSQIPQALEDTDWIIELVGELPEKLTSMIKGYNTNSLELEDDEVKFSMTDVLKFANNQTVEPISTTTPVLIPSLKNTPLMVGSIENEIQLKLLMRDMKPIKLTAIEADVDSNSAKLMLTIQALYKDPKSLNCEYISGLIRKDGRKILAGSFEDKMKFKGVKLKITSNEAMKENQNPNPIPFKRRDVHHNSVKVTSSVRPQQEKEETFLKHKSQTLINPAHEVQATTLTLSVPNRHSVGNDRDNRTLKRTFSRAQLTKMDTEIIKEVEEEGNEKSTLRAKNSRKSRDKKTSLEKNIEAEKPVKRAFEKHDTVYSEETIQFDRWHHKHTTTGSETITQIQKKHTESDFFNSATKRMLTNSSTHSIEKMYMGVLANLPESKAGYTKIPTINLIEAETSNKKPSNKKTHEVKNDHSIARSDSNSPRERKTVEVPALQNRSSLLQVPQKLEMQRPKKNKSKSCNSLTDLDEERSDRSENIAHSMNDSKLILGTSSNRFEWKSNKDVINAKHYRYHQKQHLDPVDLLFTYIYERKSIEFSSIFKHNPANFAGAKDKNGDTMLILAARSGNLNIVSEILAHNPDINVQDNEGNTPLHIALQYGHMDVADKLLAAGANQNIKNNLRKTPWEMCK